MTAKRHPTVQDFRSGRKFCILLIAVNSEMLEVRVLRGREITKIDRSGELRINPYGTIQTINLGEFMRRSASSFAVGGVIIDYEENEEQAVRTAETVVRQYQEGFIAQLRATIEQFERLSATVER